MSNRTVVILGASKYYVASIKAARKAGYRVVALDRNPDAPGLVAANVGLAVDIKDHSAVAKVVRDYGAKTIVPLNDIGVITASITAQEFSLPGINPDVARIATCKADMRHAWEKAGIQNPVYDIVSDLESLEAAVDVVRFPCILKPAYGIGGASRGVIVVNERRELANALAFSQSFYDDPRTIVESFVEADSEHSAEVLVYNGSAHVIAVGDKIKTPLPYRVDKTVLYPTALTKDSLPRIENEIEKAVIELGISIGAVHVEFAIRNDEVIFFELGARCGGGGTPEPVIRHVTGIDIFVQTIRILSGEKPEIRRTAKERGCAYHFLTPDPGRISKISGIENVRQTEGVLDAAVTLSHGDTVKEVRTGLDRAGYIITGGSDREAALRLAHRAEKLLEFEYD